MRYHLRTLLIVLALGPPTMASEADLAPLDCTFPSPAPMWLWLAAGGMVIAFLVSLAMTSPKFRFTIRDVLWLTVVVALGVGWWANRTASYSHRIRQAASLEEELAEVSCYLFLDEDDLYHLRRLPAPADAESPSQNNPPTTNHP